MLLMITAVTALKSISLKLRHNNALYANEGKCHVASHWRGGSGRTTDEMFQEFTFPQTGVFNFCGTFTFTKNIACLRSSRLLHLEGWSWFPVKIFKSCWYFCLLKTWMLWLQLKASRTFSAGLVKVSCGRLLPSSSRPSSSSCFSSSGPGFQRGAVLGVRSLILQTSCTSCSLRFSNLWLQSLKPSSSSRTKQHRGFSSPSNLRSMWRTEENLKDRWDDPGTNWIPVDT